MLHNVHHVRNSLLFDLNKEYLLVRAIYHRKLQIKSSLQIGEVLPHPSEKVSFNSRSCL